MPIRYDKLYALLRDRGYTTYKIRRDNILGQGTLTALRSGKGGLSAKSIEGLCRLLDCQPGDIMEYVPDIDADNPGD